MKKFFKYSGILLLIIAVLFLSGIIYFNSSYPKVITKKNIKIEQTAERVERGKYLVNHVAACIDCHSSRDYTLYTAPMIKGTEGIGGERFGEEMGFPGNIYAKNITPSNLKDWTDSELLNAITAGINKDGKALFPVMPYPNYAQMNIEDIKDIIAYIRTLKPVENNVPETELNFPMNFIVKTIPADYNSKPKPNRSDSINYGKYLITLAACFDCHSPADHGKVIEGKEYSGGNEFSLPSGKLKSANITPDKLTGIGSWTKDTFIKRFKAFTDSSRIYKLDFSKDFQTIMPWTLYAGMKEEDLGAIYDYLRSIKPVYNKVTVFTPSK